MGSEMCIRDRYESSDFKIGDLVEVFIHDGKSKRGSWTSPRQVLSIDHDAGCVSVPGRAGKSLSAAVEDVRAATGACELASSIQDSIDQLDFNLVEMTSGESDSDVISKDSEIDNDVNVTVNVIEDDFDVNNEPPDDFDGSNNGPLPTIGDRIAIYWPQDDKHYPGTVHSVNDDNTRVIHYDDDDIETLNLINETWHYVTNSSLQANSANFDCTLDSNEQSVLNEMLEAVGNRPFLRHHCLLYTSPSPRDLSTSRMPSSA